MARRKLLLINITENDGVTKKVAKAEQNFNYDELLNETFVEGYEPVLGYSALLIPLNRNVLKGMDLRTSNVQEVLVTEEEFVETVVIKTLNTFYFFEVISVIE